MISAAGAATFRRPYVCLSLFFFFFFFFFTAQRTHAAMPAARATLPVVSARYAQPQRDGCSVCRQVTPRGVAAGAALR